MKHLFFAFAIGLTAMGCSRYGQEEQLTTDLKETWLLTEKHYGMMNWQKVSKEDNTPTLLRVTVPLLLPNLVSVSMVPIKW